MTTAAATVEARLTGIWGREHDLLGWLSSVDHKDVGRRYLVTAFAFLLLGGVEALLMRAQLAGPRLELLSPDAYDKLFTMHGTTMMFLYASPILSGFGNYLVPLFCGTRDMAYPRLNAFSYWVFLFSGLFLYASFLFGAAPDGGWFAYVPLTSREYSPGVNIDFFALGLLFLGISTTAGAINFITTILKMRAPGMSLNRMPLYLWSTLTTAAVILLALPALSAGLILLELDRLAGMAWFDAAAGGTPLLWQHLFWIFGHPWVYILFLPAAGIVNMVLPVFSRRPMAGYAWVAFSAVATGFIGFGVWVHHMFATGLSPASQAFFSSGSMLVAVPTIVTVFAWIATVWFGHPRLDTPMLFCLGFVVLFVLGGLTGVMVAVVPFDLQVHDSYFVVAHLHYVVVGGNLFPVLAGFYYWLPKITGRMLDERLGKANFWLMFVGFNVLYFPMHVSGLLGMPRRVYTYEAFPGWSWLNLVTSAGAVLFALGVLLFVANLAWSLRRGREAGPDPWGANTLEWSTPSPTPTYNFRTIPIVRTRDPLWDREHYVEDEARGALLLDEAEEVLRTSALDAEPERVVEMPGESLLPLATTVALTGLFAGLLVTDRTLMVLFGLATAGCVLYWLWPTEEGPGAEVSGAVPGR